MEDLQTILSSHHSKTGNPNSNNPMHDGTHATTSEIPDLFFDDVLVDFKLTRVEVLLLMYLYRLTWCKPNLHVKYGIAPFVSHEEITLQLDISFETLHQTVRRLEGYGFIETIRSGQYFVRKYYTEEYDRKYGQTYDNFL